MRKSPATFFPAIISWVFVLLFVYTAASKLSTHRKFEVVIRESPLVGDTAAWVSWLIPVVEGLIAILLVIPRWRSLGLIASSGLMLMFTVYVGYMLAFSDKLPCACGGVLNGLSWKEHLGFNLSFTLLAALGVYFDFMTKDFIAINRVSRKPV